MFQKNNGQNFDIKTTKKFYLWTIDNIITCILEAGGSRNTSPPKCIIYTLLFLESLVCLPILNMQHARKKISL